MVGLEGTANLTHLTSQKPEVTRGQVEQHVVKRDGLGFGVILGSRDPRETRITAPASSPSSSICE